MYFAVHITEVELSDVMWMPILLLEVLAFYLILIVLYKILKNRHVKFLPISFLITHIIYSFGICFIELQNLQFQYANPFWMIPLWITCFPTSIFLILFQFSIFSASTILGFSPFALFGLETIAEYNSFWFLSSFAYLSVTGSIWYYFVGKIIRDKGTNGLLEHNSKNSILKIPLCYIIKFLEKKKTKD